MKTYQCARASTEMGRDQLKATMHPYDFSVRPQVVERDWMRGIPEYQLQPAWLSDREGRGIGPVDDEEIRS